MIFFCFLEICHSIYGEDFADHHKMINIYQKVINNMCNSIQILSKKFDNWWSFKPDSLIKKYLDHNKINMDQYFCKDTLCKAIENLFNLKKFSQLYNQEIFLLDFECQKIFNANLIYKPEIFNYIYPELEKVPEHLRKELQTQQIKNCLAVFCPREIIFLDNSACFWLFPYVNKLMETGKIIFTWTELTSLFLDFCTTNQENFVRHQDIIEIKQNSPMSNVFPFQYFHISQTEYVVKKISKYLGRQSFENYCCPYFKKPLFPNPTYHHTIKWIENFIDDTFWKLKKPSPV